MLLFVQESMLMVWIFLLSEKQLGRILMRGERVGGGPGAALNWDKNLNLMCVNLGFLSPGSST